MSVKTYKIVIITATLHISYRVIHSYSVEDTNYSYSCDINTNKASNRWNLHSSCIARVIKPVYQLS